MTATSGYRLTVHRRKHSFRRWRVLPPEGQGECDFNPKIEPAFADDKPHQFRHSAAVHQIDEALRLAKQFALLRPGTEPREVSARRRRILPRVRAVIRAWRELLDKLRAAGWP